MAAAVTVDAKVTYGTFEVGAGTDFLIQAPYRLTLEYRTGSFECEVLISATTEAELISHESSLQAAWTKPRQRLLVEIGGATRWDFNPSDGSGFDQEPRCTKLVQEETNTGLCSRWQLQVGFAMPADLTGQAGRTDNRVAIRVARTGKRVIELEGIYTTLTGGSALTQYEDNIGTYETSVQNAVDSSADWELAEPELKERNDTDTTVRFRKVFQELLGTQRTGGQDANLWDTTFSIVEREHNETGHARPLKTPIDLIVQYRTLVSKSLASTEELRTKWEDTIRPHLVDRVRAATGGGKLVLLDAAPEYEENGPAVRVTAHFRMYRGNLYRYRQEVEDTVRHGWILTPLWGGGPFDREEELGPASHFRVVTTQSLRQRTGRQDLLSAGSQAKTLTLNGVRFVRTETRRRRSVLIIGVQGYENELESLVEVALYERSDQVEGTTTRPRSGDGIAGVTVSDLNAELKGGGGDDRAELRGGGGDDRAEPSGFLGEAPEREPIIRSGNPETGAFIEVTE